MKFGFALPYSIARQVADTAYIAEKAGWDGLFIGDAIWCSDPMVALAAAAMVTHTIRLGLMVIPAPIRVPWKVASESLSVDHLSNGRLTLGLATGATWMGWQSFPDEVTDTKARAEMLGEMIDLLTLLYKSKQFDYIGKHYRVLLTRTDEQHYPPKPIQQPRIPLWVTGVWPRKTSMKRAMKGDGLIPHKINNEGKLVEVTPADLREMKAYVEDQRGLDTPFDYIVEGQILGLEPSQIQEKLGAWQAAGGTWFIESTYGLSYEQIQERIQQGPPKMG
jgi:alkanesulfonate monooxygenase SsuD/methylene tetrahydromethanopterin reductase-like flavin-dependent oxidoreductase (luciferase family)